MRTIRFNCSCGRRLLAEIFDPQPDGESKITFFEGYGEPPKAVTECPNCQRDFSRVTVDEFLDGVANWS
jgi:hypothetical protein